MFICLLNCWEQLIMKDRTYFIWNYLLKDHRIHYRVEGIGEKHLLLLHGCGSHTCTWSDLMDSLVKAGFKVWALDLLGFGFSDKPLDVPYGLDLYMKQVMAFMQTMRIPQADFISHSMGGTISLGMAFSYPHHVKSLTLISPLAYPLRMPLSLRFAQKFPALMQLLSSERLVGMMRKNVSVNRAVTCTPQKIKEAAEPYSMENGLKVSLKVPRAFDNSVLQQLSGRYPRIKQDTLVVMGTQDLLIPANHSENFKRDISHAEICLMDQCGHIPHEEYPEQVGNVILKFLHKKAEHA